MVEDPYKAAGVDTALGDQLAEWLAQGQNYENPTRPRHGELVEGIGGFASMVRPRFGGMTDPLLVASTDGVGTKLLLALEANDLSGLGQDLVGMCVNDLYAVGAEPLFFLDYYASGRLDKAQFQTVLRGIKEALDLCGCLLVGGETAELPGLYQGKHFDLAGFVVGVVDGAVRPQPAQANPQDLIFGFESTGFHSNGFSLLRKWIGEQNLLSIVDTKTLLRPTRIYSFVPELLRRLPQHSVRGLAHITGGGLSGNLPRAIPPHLCAHIQRTSIPTPAWVHGILSHVGATVEAVEPVFNLGIGLALVVARNLEGEFCRIATEVANEVPKLLGHLEPRRAGDGEIIYV